MSEGKNLMNEISTDTTDVNSVPVAPADQTPAEKLLPQTQVNALVGSAKQKGYEKGYQEALSKLNAQTPPQNISSDPDSLRRIAEESVAKKLQELQVEAERKAAEQQGMQILNELGSKITQDKQQIPDFDKVVDLKNFVNAPEVLHLANSVDNSGHVLYELTQNPSKLNTIIGLVRNGLPAYAHQAVKQLSDSIKQNQLAVQQPKAPEPLNQIKPSNLGLGNGGPKSVSELRNDPAYRG